MSYKYDFHSQELVAEDVVHDKMASFAEAVALDKVIHAVDGLKSGYRRILWAIRHHKEFTNLYSFVGKVMEHHPVGDRSINDACMRCMQPHSVGIPLLEGKGNTGRYYDEDCGANRYLSVRISEFTREVFFQGIDLSTIPTVEKPTFDGEEPKFLIPKLPMALLMYTLTLGTGFKSEVFPMNLTNLCNLLLRYLDHRAKDKYAPFYVNKYPELLIPDFPIRNIITNSDQIIRSHEREDYSPTLKVEGIFDVSGQKITLRTTVFGASFGKVEQNLKTLLRDKNSWIQDLFTEYHNLATIRTEGALEITVKKTVDPIMVAKRLAKELRLYKGIKAIPIYGLPNNTLRTMTPAEIIALWFNYRKGSIISGLKHDQIELVRQANLLKVKIMLADHWDDVISIVRTPNRQPDDIREELQARYALTYEQAENILQGSSILSVNDKVKDKNIEALNKLQDKISELAQARHSPDDQIEQDIEFFKKKYGTPRKTKISQYLGQVFIKNGKNTHSVQFDDYEEALQYLKDYPTATVHEYDPDWKVTHYVNAEGLSVPMKTTLPKRFDDYLHLSTPKKPYTITLNDSTEAIFKGVVFPSNPNVQSYIVGNKFYGIKRSGEITLLKPSDMTSRKTKDAKGRQTEYVHFVPAHKLPGVLVYFNDKTPDELYFMAISEETTKLNLGIFGTPIFLDCISRKRKLPYILNLPATTDSTVSHIYIESIEKVMRGGDFIKVALKRKLKRHPVSKNIGIL